MYLIGHAAVGMALAGHVENPAVALGIGWASHYLADFFPHGDEAIGEWAMKKNELRRFAFLLSIDGVVVLAAFAVLVMANGFSLPLAAAAVGSFVPDVMWGLEKVTKRQLFGFFGSLHRRNHNFFHIRLSPRIGLPLQFAVAALLWWQVAAH